jgi:hypothetical protein
MPVAIDNPLEKCQCAIFKPKEDPSHLKTIYAKFAIQTKFPMAKKKLRHAKSI